MLTTFRTPKMKYESRWYLAERASHARALSEPMRPTAKQSAAADGKAEEYARWLLARDGIDLAALAERVRAEHNAKFPPVKHRSGSRKWETPHDDAIPMDMKQCAFVRWDVCAAGRRPRSVVFAFHNPAVNGFRRLPARTYATVYELELPHWDVELSLDSACEGEA